MIELRYFRSNANVVPGVAVCTDGQSRTFWTGPLREMPVEVLHRAQVVALHPTTYKDLARRVEGTGKGTPYVEADRSGPDGPYEA